MSKLINKNIIKAMTIGISAVVTFGSLNLAALAENENSAPIEPDNGKNEVANTSESALTAAINQANKVYSETEKAVSDVRNVVNETNNFNETVSEVGLSTNTITEAAEGLNSEINDRDWNDTLQDNQIRRFVKAEVRPAWDETVRAEWTEIVKINLRLDENGDEIYDGTEEVVHPAEIIHHEAEYEYRFVEYFDDNNYGLGDAEEAMKYVKDAVIVMDDMDTLASGTVASANVEADKINGYDDKDGNHVDGYVEIAETLEQKAEDLLKVENVSLADYVIGAGDAIDEAAGNIKNAESKEKADEYKQDAQDAYDAADKTVNEKEKEFAELERQYNENELKYYSVKKEYDAKLVDLKAKKDRFQDLKNNADLNAGCAVQELQRLDDSTNDLVVKVNEDRKEYCDHNDSSSFYYTTVTGAYDKILTSAQTADQTITETKADIEKLRGQIAALECKHDARKLDEYKASLKAAKETLKKAIEERNNLQKKLEIVEEEYKERIAELENGKQEEGQKEEQKEEKKESSESSEESKNVVDNSTKEKEETNSNNTDTNTEDNTKAEDDTKPDDTETKAEDNTNADDTNVNGNNNSNVYVNTNNNVDNGIIADENAAGGNIGGGAVGGNGGRLDLVKTEEEAVSDTIEADEIALAEGVVDVNDDSSSEINVEAAEESGDNTVETANIENDNSALAETIGAPDAGKKSNWLWAPFGGVIAGVAGFGIFKMLRRKNGTDSFNK